MKIKELQSQLAVYKETRSIELASKILDQLIEDFGV